MSGPVPDLEQALAAGAAAAGEPVAAVLARELDAVLLEPVDRARGLARQHLDESAVSRLVRALPDVLAVLLGRVVVAEGRLDAALRLGRVAGLERSLGDETYARVGLSGGHGSGQPGGAAPDDEHVECVPLGHDRRSLANSRD